MIIRELVGETHDASHAHSTLDFIFIIASFTQLDLRVAHLNWFVVANGEQVHQPIMSPRDQHPARLADVQALNFV